MRIDLQWSMRVKRRSPVFNEIPSVEPGNDLSTEPVLSVAEVIEVTA